jgi:hypothetical protein
MARKMQLDQHLNPKHPLFRLAQQIEKLSEDDDLGYFGDKHAYSPRL